MDEEEAALAGEPVSHSRPEAPPEGGHGLPEDAEDDQGPGSDLSRAAHAARGALGNLTRLKHLSPRGRIWIRNQRASKSRKGKGPRFVPSMVAAALRKLCDVALAGLDPRVQALARRGEAPGVSPAEAAEAHRAIKLLIQKPRSGSGLQAPTGDAAADLLLVLEPEEAVFLAALPDCNLPPSPLNFHRLPAAVREAVLRSALPKGTSSSAPPLVVPRDLSTPKQVPVPGWLRQAESACQGTAPARLKGHIIIGGDLSGLPDLIRPLRRATSQVVVVLAPRASLRRESSSPEARVWRMVKRVYSGLVHVDGSPLRPKDLLRAGVQRAGCVLILSSEGAAERGSSGSVQADSAGVGADGVAAAMTRDLGALYTASAVLLFSQERERELAGVLRKQRDDGLSTDHARLGGIGDGAVPGMAAVTSSAAAAMDAYDVIDKLDRGRLERSRTEQEPHAGQRPAAHGAGPIGVTVEAPPELRSASAIQRMARDMPATPVDPSTGRPGSGFTAQSAAAAARRASLLGSAPSFAIGTSGAHASFFAGRPSELSVSAAVSTLRPDLPTQMEDGQLSPPGADFAAHGTAARQRMSLGAPTSPAGPRGAAGSDDDAIHSASLMRAASLARHGVPASSAGNATLKTKRSMGAQAIMESMSAEGLQSQVQAFASLEADSVGVAHNTADGGSHASSSTTSRRSVTSARLADGRRRSSDALADGGSSRTGSVDAPRGRRSPDAAPSLGSGQSRKDGSADRRATPSAAPHKHRVAESASAARGSGSKTKGSSRGQSSRSRRSEGRSSAAGTPHFVPRPAGAAQALVGATPRVMIELADDTSIRFLSSTLQHPVVAQRRRNVRAAMLRAKAAELQLPPDDGEGRAAADDVNAEIATALEEAGMGNPSRSTTARGAGLGQGEETESSRLRPLFASGRVFLGAMLDSLATGLLFNPLLLRIVTQLLYGASAPGATSSSEGTCDPRLAAGLPVIVRADASPQLSDDIVKAPAHDESGGGWASGAMSGARSPFTPGGLSEPGGREAASIGPDPPGHIGLAHLAPAISKQPPSGVWGSPSPSAMVSSPAPKGPSPRDNKAVPERASPSPSQVMQAGLPGLRVTPPDTPRSAASSGDNTTGPEGTSSGAGFPGLHPVTPTSRAAHSSLGADSPRTPGAPLTPSASASAAASSAAAAAAAIGLKVNKWRFKQHDFLRQLAVPESFHGRRFHSLFQFLVVEHRMVPLALFRSAEALGAPAPYVVTNPRPDLRVHRQDRVFVLCGVEHVNPAPRQFRERPILEQERSAARSQHRAHRQGVASGFGVGDGTAFDFSGLGHAGSDFARAAGGRGSAASGTPAGAPEGASGSEKALRGDDLVGREGEFGQPASPAAAGHRPPPSLRRPSATGRGAAAVTRGVAITRLRSPVLRQASGRSLAGSSASSTAKTARHTPTGESAAAGPSRGAGSGGITGPRAGSARAHGREGQSRSLTSDDDDAASGDSSSTASSSSHGSRAGSLAESDQLGDDVTAVGPETAPPPSSQTARVRSRQPPPPPPRVKRGVRAPPATPPGAFPEIDSQLEGLGIVRIDTSLGMLGSGDSSPSSSQPAASPGQVGVRSGTATGHARVEGAPSRSGSSDSSNLGSSPEVYRGGDSPDPATRSRGSPAGAMPAAAGRTTPGLPGRSLAPEGLGSGRPPVGEQASPLNASRSSDGLPPLLPGSVHRQLPSVPPARRAALSTGQAGGATVQATPFVGLSAVASGNSDTASTALSAHSPSERSVGFEDALPRVVGGGGRAAPSSHQLSSPPGTSSGFSPLGHASMKAASSTRASIAGTEGASKDATAPRKALRKVKSGATSASVGAAALPFSAEAANRSRFAVRERGLTPVGLHGGAGPEGGAGAGGTSSDAGSSSEVHSGPSRGPPSTQAARGTTAHGSGGATSPGDRSITQRGRWEARAASSVVGSSVAGSVTSFAISSVSSGDRALPNPQGDASSQPRDGGPGRGRAGSDMAGSARTSGAASEAGAAAAPGTSSPVRSQRVRVVSLPSIAPLAPGSSAAQPKRE